MVTPTAPAAVHPPPTSVLARISDPRAAQFWDPGQLTSTALWDAAQRHASWPIEELRNPAGVIWDTALVFAPGVRWEGDPPVPVYAGGNVVDVIEEVRKHL